MPTSAPPPPPSDVWHLTELLAAALSALGGIVGRFMALSQERRDVITVGLFVWELPTAVGMGWVARGVAEYLEVGGFKSFALSIVAGYLGPRIISYTIQRTYDIRMRSRG